LLSEVAKIQKILSEITLEGADHAMATMVDRLAPEGRLRDLVGITTTEQLEQAFPISAFVTKHLARGGFRKVAISRWPQVEIHLRGAHLRHASKWCGHLQHFKWRSDLHERLVKRYIDYTLTHIPWVGESERILNELQQYGRIRVERWMSIK
jgi:hypothetical protein